MTFEPLELLRLIHDRVDGPSSVVLDPLAVARKHGEYRRGGFPARSMPEHTTSGSEKPLPVTQRVSARDSDGYETAWHPVGPADSFDALANRRAKSFARHIANALRELDAAFEDQSWFVEIAEPVPEDDPVATCTNVECFKQLEPGRKTGECSRCRRWRHTHQLPFPLVRTT